MEYNRLLTLIQDSLIIDSNEGVSFGAYKVSWSLPQVSSSIGQMASDRVKTEIYKMLLDSDPILIAKGIFAAVNDDTNSYRTVEDFTSCVNLVEGALKEMRAYFETMQSLEPDFRSMYMRKIRNVDSKLENVSEYRNDHNLFEGKAPILSKNELSDHMIWLIKRGYNPDRHQRVNDDD